MNTITTPAQQRAPRGLSSIVRRAPLASFLALTFAFSWSIWPLYAMSMIPVPIFAAGPFVAALIVTALTIGRTGVTDLFRRMLRWRVGPGWYVVALGLPVAITVMAVLITFALGVSPRWPTPGVDWLSLVGGLALNLLLPGLGGTWEEPGWRGYLLPQLQARRSSLIASLILGVIGVTWHLPLFLAGEIQWSDILSIFAAYIVFAWLYNRTGGSILLVMIAHATNNTISGGFFSQMFSGSGMLLESWCLAALWAIAAAVILALEGSNLGRRMAAQPEPSR
jgi:membrane protease YdiL (CAAX protease family)